MVKGTTNLVGVMGWPVGHSLSPALHNAAFRELGLDWVYVPLLVDPTRLEEAVQGLLGLGFRGANVTIPHKEKVMALLDEVSFEAQHVGAVNTILVKDGRLYGDNTDAMGFLDALEDIGFDPVGCTALILGSGGSARAVGYALAQQDVQITISGRKPSSIAELSERIRETNSAAKVTSLPLEGIAGLNGQFDLIVNTTPVGMHPAVRDSPWPHGMAIPRCRALYDLVYNPPVTTIMQQARAQGIRAENGLGMLIHQAARSFSLWTGLPAPVDIMKKVAVQC